MSHAVAGLLGSIPVVCMGILAPLGPVLAGSIGPRFGAALCVLLVVGFGVLRAVTPDAFTALLTTVGIGVGMAVVGPILAMVVRRRTPDHPAAGTGAYVVGLVLGATATAAVAVPLAETLGGWRGAVAVISAAGLVSLLGWLWLMPADAAGTTRVRPRLPRLPWRRRSAWLLGVIFGTQSVLFYGAITWLPSLYVERGWTATDAAGLVGDLHGHRALRDPRRPGLCGPARHAAQPARDGRGDRDRRRGADCRDPRRTVRLAGHARCDGAPRPRRRVLLPARADAAGRRVRGRGGGRLDLRADAPRGLPDRLDRARPVRPDPGCDRRLRGRRRRLRRRRDPDGPAAAPAEHRPAGRAVPPQSVP